MSDAMGRADAMPPILMVDDSEEDLLIARRCHRRSSSSMPWQSLPSGHALLAHLDRIEAGAAPMPAVVLLDINMPGISGFEALERLRARPGFGELPPVIVLTNSDSPGDVQRARALGAAGFQVKPTRVAEYVAFFDDLAARLDAA